MNDEGRSGWITKGLESLADEVGFYPMGNAWGATGAFERGWDRDGIMRIHHRCSPVEG